MLAVITSHVSGSAATSELPFVEKFPFLMYGGCSVWANIIFVMVSGMFLLDPTRTVTVKKLYRKNILRIVKVFFFWSAVYATAWAVLKHKTLYDWVGNLLSGFYHQWFLIMLIGLYIVTPLLRRITEHREDTLYFLQLALVFSLLVPIALALPLPWSDSFLSLWENMNFYSIPLYAACYVGGYVLSHYDFSARQRKILYAASILGFLLIPVRAVLSEKGIRVDGEEVFQIMQVLQAVGLFTFARYRISREKVSSFWQRTIPLLSKFSLCIYMIHVMVIEALAELFDFSSASFTPLLSVPLIVVGVFFVSLPIAAIMHRIPILKDHVV